MNTETNIIDPARVPTTSNRRTHGRGRLAGFATIGLIGLIGLTACTSDPSAQRVAKDLVNTLAKNDAQRDCMLEKLNAYDKSEVEAIAKSAGEVSQNVGELTPLQEFENNLAACNSLT